MSERANALYIQSGGPTAVINTSAYGVIDECRKSEKIDCIYASEHGIRGVIEKKIFDITKELKGEKLLTKTPAMIFGSCRYEIDEEDPEKRDYKKVMDTLEALHIRYVFINGGNGSVRAGLRLSRYLQSQNYDFKLIVVPKTVDNDISCIDHAPGFPSAARHVVITVSELARDMMTYDTELILFAEVMGRNTGFLAAASLAAGEIEKGPDLIYVPEVVFNPQKFMTDIRRVLKEKGKCFVVVAEGVKTAAGRFLFEDMSVNRGMDMKKNMGGIVPYLNQLLRKNFDCKIRGIDLGLMQRCSIHDASETDKEEAEELGRRAVRAALAGESVKMVTLSRTPGNVYQAAYSLVSLEEVSKSDKCLPLSYVNETGDYVKEEFLEYILPLIGKLPEYTILEKNYVDIET